MAAAQRGEEKALRLLQTGGVLPHLVTAQRPHALDADLATFAAFGHALGGFETVEVVFLNPAVADADAFAQRCAPWQVDGGQTARHGQ